MELLKIENKNKIHTFKKQYDYGIYYVSEETINGSKIFFSYDFSIKFPPNERIYNSKPSNEFSFSCGYYFLKNNENKSLNLTRQIFEKQYCPAPNDFIFLDVHKKIFLEFCKNNLYKILEFLKSEEYLNKSDIFLMIKSWKNYG